MYNFLIDQLCNIVSQLYVLNIKVVLAISYPKLLYLLVSCKIRKVPLRTFICQVETNLQRLQGTTLWSHKTVVLNERLRNSSRLRNIPSGDTWIIVLDFQIICRDAIWYEINLHWTKKIGRGLLGSTDWHRRVKNRCYSEGRGHSDDRKHILAVARECRSDRSYDVAPPCRECSSS